MLPLNTFEVSVASGIKANLLFDSSNELTEYQRDWLNAYCQTWDILQDVENNEEVESVTQCIIDTNGDYAECVDHFVETMEVSNK